MLEVECGDVEHFFCVFGIVGGDERCVRVEEVVFLKKVVNCLCKRVAYLEDGF